jgi:hypothetical protein
MRVVRIVILLAALLCISRGVYADPVTVVPAAPTVGFTQIFFSDTNESFRWEFTWDGVTAVGFDAARGADDQQPGIQWNGDSTVNNNGPRAEFLGASFDFSARHVTRAHPLDVQMGDPYLFQMKVNGLVQTRTFSVLNRQCVPHEHNPDPHADCYLLGYTRPAVGGPVTFEFSGVHVPEPTTLVLITTGLAGVAIKMRKRLNNRKR